MLAAITLWAAFVLLSPRPSLSNDEIRQLKALAARSAKGSAGQAGKSAPAAPFSNDEIQRLKALAAGSAKGSVGQAGKSAPAAPFSSDEVQTLKGLADESNNLDRLAENSKEILADKANAVESEKIKEDVKDFLEWVIAIAGIFTIAQAIAAGFTAQSFTRQAERDIRELDNFKNDYGVIAVAGQAQTQAFNLLKEQFTDGKWPDWRTKLYSTMDVVKRQSVLSADRYLGFDLLLLQGRVASVDGDTGSQQAATLRGLANFYASKYEFEQQLKSGQWQDLERAHHLLQSWLNSHASDFAIHNDLGLVLCNCANHCRDTKDYDREHRFRLDARAEFDTSVRLMPLQQRAYYNLAIIAADLYKPKDWPQSAPPPAFQTGLRQAIELCGTALRQTKWESTPNSSMETEIRYNLACFLALECYCLVRNQTAAPQTTISHERMKPIFSELEKVADPSHGTILKRYVDSDYKEEGDLGLLNRYLSQADREQLNNYKEGIYAHATSE